MKRWIACALASAIVAGARCALPTPNATVAQKLVILGFDGMDPDLVETFINQGKLPTFAKLAAAGGLHRLQTSHSPQCPTAWASFATGVNAARHNIYDLVTRDPATYRPVLAKAPGAGPFWITAGHAAVRSSVLSVPVPLSHEEVPTGGFDEAAFVADLDRAFDERAAAILKSIDAKNWAFLVGLIDATDRVQHRMWRLIDRDHPMHDAALARAYGGAIEAMYRRADGFVGEVLTHLDPDTTVLIVSDHGFHSFRWSVNLNTWLVERGYMVLHGRTPARKPTGAVWEDVDWSKTRAYSMGLGQIFVNLRGREGQGAVTAGVEYDELLDSLIIDLMSYLDPLTQARVVASVYKRSEIHDGPYVGNAPDLQVALEPGYRVSWQTATGGVAARVIEPNMTTWSGDHASFDDKVTAGVLITNRRIKVTSPRIIDIAPTVLKHFGMAVPSGLDGRSVFH